MPRISSPRPLDLTKPFVTSSQSYGSAPFDLSEGLVTWYRDIQGDFVPDLSGYGSTARCAGSGSHSAVKSSGDTPEYNPLSYPIRSFDFTKNASSPFDVDHISSVNSDGLAAPLDNHSFTDGTNDVPFTVSMWIKAAVTPSNVYFASKRIGTYTSIEWEIACSISNSIRFNLYSQNTSTSIAATITSLAYPGLHDGWDHFVFTYDGSGVKEGLTIYRNGVDATSSRTGVGYVAMSKTNAPLCIGSFFTNTSLKQLSTNDFIGKIHSFAIWKNRELNSTEVQALYFAYVNGTGGKAKSGFISRSTRLHLRELDDLPGSYPTVRRDGDPTRSGALASNFNDETTIQFLENSDVVFPTMLPRGSSFASQAVDIIGQESDISATLPIRSFQQPNFLHYSPTESVGPFNENRAAQASDFFLSGTNPDILPGFSSPLRSKAAIEIDITPSSSTRLMRNVDRRTTAEGGTSIGDQSGFMYYNFERKEWEQIGLRNPLNGTPIYFDYAIDAGSVTGSFPMQFTVTPGFPSENVTYRNAGGYAKIGSPTAALGAPAKAMYHATGSQCLRMSDYISEPFLLEKIRVVFDEVHAQRIQGDAPSGLAAARKGANRDIDNYVFFAYHQRYLGAERDTSLGVLNSRRDLIFSGSMTFWNSASFYNSSVSDAVITHTPAFDHNFGLSYSTGRQVGAFTGSIEMNLAPAVSGRQREGINLIPSSSINGAFDQWIGTFWTGGTSFNKFDADPANVSAFVNFSDFFAWSSKPSIDSFTPKNNSRSFRSFGGEAAPGISNGTIDSVISQVEQSAQSPYLLLPSDEIVFGLEAGVTSFRFASSFSSITGSHLEITSKPCKVVFYGSFIKDSLEKLPVLNQDLSSNSIHEVVGAETPVDQFQVEPITSYYGSYLDGIVTGSMAIPSSDGLSFTTYDQDQSRRVISYASIGQAGSSGSLQRFVRVPDSAERLFDSCLPSYADFFKDEPNVTISATNKIYYAGGTSYIETPDQEVISFNNFPQMLEIGSRYYNQFPFQYNPTRQLSVNGTIKAESGVIEPTAYGSDISQFLKDYYLVNASAADVAYRINSSSLGKTFGPSPSTFLFEPTRDYDSLGTSIPIVEPPILGPFRYGVSNTKPSFSAACWKSDHYGFVRDMLEPRQVTATFDGVKPIKIRFVSGSNIIYDPLNTHAQNLSTFATSSMPYFDDGVARNRPDNPDETLVIAVTA